MQLVDAPARAGGRRPAEAEAPVVRGRRQGRQGRRRLRPVPAERGHDARERLRRPDRRRPARGAALPAAPRSPLEERVALWRERLGRVTGNAWGVASVYRGALAACEAPTWRERSRLHTLLLDAMPGVGAKVSLWRTLFDDRGAADALYRGMLARARTPEEVRQLHDALGLRAIDPGELAKMMKEAKTPADRATKLRGLVAVWPDDFSLALRLLDALEDAGDDAGACEPRPQALGAPRRGRAGSHRGGRNALPAPRGAGEGRGRQGARTRARRGARSARSWSSRPDDPIARRRIGDLLRAHGWYEDAARQYETLARLTPDDASVPLLLAAAAGGHGQARRRPGADETGRRRGIARRGAEPRPHRPRLRHDRPRLGARLGRARGGPPRRRRTRYRRAPRARVRSAERAAPEALRGTRVTPDLGAPRAAPRALDWNARSARACLQPPRAT